MVGTSAYEARVKSTKPQNESAAMTGIGWIVAIVIIIVVYDKLPKTRSFIAGTMSIVALGIVLRYQSNVTNAFREIFFMKVE